jgi:hypothetical protein
MGCFAVLAGGIAAVGVAAVLTLGLLLRGGDATPDPPPPYGEDIWSEWHAKQDATRVEWLESHGSSEEHDEMIRRCAARMAAHGYVDKDDPVEAVLEIRRRAAIDGLKTDVPPGLYPYEMAWYLSICAFHLGEQVPVSLLHVEQDAPFEHLMAVAAVQEFRRIVPDLPTTEELTAVMQRAERRFEAARRGASNEGTWDISSGIPAEPIRNTDPGKYFLQVQIHEWEPESPELRNPAPASSRLELFFVYLPPGRPVHLRKVEWPWCDLDRMDLTYGDK